MIWEFLDVEGLWQAISDRESYEIEARYADEINSFDLNESDNSIRYNIGSHQRSITKNRQNQRIKRTPFIWERPEGAVIGFMHAPYLSLSLSLPLSLPLSLLALHQKMLDLPVSRSILVFPPAIWAGGCMGVVCTWSTPISLKQHIKRSTKL